MSIFLAKRIIANLRDNSSLDSVNTKDPVLPENSTEKKKKYTQKKCSHGKLRNRCVSCGGSSICVHHRVHHQCIECGGSSICIHRKIRHMCIECKGTGICIHHKIRAYCVDCCGSQICIHRKIRSVCLICSSLPTLTCDYPFCGYQTKRKIIFRNHIKIHSEDNRRNRKKKETLIAQVLTKNNIPYTREHTVTYKCISDINNSSSRIDFVLEHRDQQGIFGLIFLEVDEHQHKWNMLSCEISRMSKIIESLRVDGNMLPIRFVRYNPDAFTVNGAKMKMKQDERHRMLLQTLTATVFERPFGVKYLFYDSDENERPCVLKDSDYFESFKSFVL